MEIELDGVSAVARHLEVKRVRVHAANAGPAMKRCSVCCSVLVGVARDPAEIGNSELSRQRVRRKHYAHAEALCRSAEAPSPLLPYT